MILRTLLTHPPGASWTRMHDDPFIVVQGAFNRSLGDACSSNSLSVRLDVQEDEGAYRLTADLPGLSENEIEVTFEEGVLTLSGEKKIAREEGKGTWHITERSQGSFTRRVTLPNGVDTDKIEAHFNKGVLSLTLPKVASELPKAKKIQVKSVN